jgi:hypothetical protein
VCVYAGGCACVCERETRLARQRRFEAGEVGAGNGSEINSRQTQSGGREDERRRARFAGRRTVGQDHTNREGGNETAVVRPRRGQTRRFIYIQSR